MKSLRYWLSTPTKESVGNRTTPMQGVLPMMPVREFLFIPSSDNR